MAELASLTASCGSTRSAFARTRTACRLGSQVSTTRILGRRTATFPPFLIIPNRFSRLPKVLVLDAPTNRRAQVGARRAGSL